MIMYSYKSIFYSNWILVHLIIICASQAKDNPRKQVPESKDKCLQLFKDFSLSKAANWLGMKKYRYIFLETNDISESANDTL